MVVKRCGVLLLMMAAACTACTTTSPSPTAMPPTVTFGGLTGNGAGCPPAPQNPSCVVSTYTESGFTVSATAGDWIALTTHGNPAPFIEFLAPSGTTVTDEIQVTASGSTFAFKSIDLYSSINPVPYTITGLRNSTTMFTMVATLPNPGGKFATVVNPEAAVLVDTLVISLSNPAPAGGGGATPVGLDNIVMTR